MKYLHSLTSSQSRSMQSNSPLVHNGMPPGTMNSPRSSIGNWVSCLHDWLLLANAINYSRLSQLIALRNLTSPTQTIQVIRTGHTRHCWKNHGRSWVTFSYGPLHIIVPARTCIQQLSFNKECSLEDLPGAMDDRDRWREIEKERERVREMSASNVIWWWR